MSNFAKLVPIDCKGRVRMVVETPRGSSTKFKFDEDLQIFTVSRTLALGVAYPFDWGFIPNTRSEDGDAVDALCIHYQPSFPGVVLPCRCLAVVDVDQKGGAGRVGNPRVILAPAWEGTQAFQEAELSERAKAEIERFFLNATLFTDKDARIVGWRGADAAEQLIRESIL